MFESIRDYLGAIWERLRDMTTPRRWPTNAKWARDDAAQDLQDAIKHLTPLLNHNDDAVAAASGRAAFLTQKALRTLEAVGAATKPQR